MLESELQRKKELVARICVALKRRQEKMIKARSRFKHMARSLYWSVIWPSITSRYSHCQRRRKPLLLSSAWWLRREILSKSKEKDGDSIEERILVQALENVELAERRLREIQKLVGDVDA